MDAFTRIMRIIGIFAGNNNTRAITAITSAWSVLGQEGRDIKAGQELLAEQAEAMVATGNNPAPEVIAAFETGILARSKRIGDVDLSDGGG